MSDMFTENVNRCQVLYIKESLISGSSVTGVTRPHFRLRKKAPVGREIPVLTQEKICRSTVGKSLFQEDPGYNHE